MNKYHVALSFAGEDRDYVEQVANELKDNGVDVFYDRYEDTTLWGKNLYAYLSEIYKDQAIYTVIFISEHYKRKLWTNHERESAQARAFEESREYILPAIFDESVEIPGVLKTTGHINLDSLSPQNLASKIIKKLENNGISLMVDKKFNYSADAKSDIDFTLPKDEEFSNIIHDLKSYNWYTQNPAIERFYELEVSKLSQDQLFIMGRNIYQCATGSENRALEIVENLRKEMATFPLEAAEHLINGMFYEVYFNSKGEFRGIDLKSRFLEKLLTIQTVKKYEGCISFIRRALKPYRQKLAILPCNNPEKFILDIIIKEIDPPLVASIKHKEKELIVDYSEDDKAHKKLWKLSFRKFTTEILKKEISSKWHIPIEQIEINCNVSGHENTAYKFHDNKNIQPPFDY